MEYDESERTPLTSRNIEPEQNSVGFNIAKCCSHVILLGCGGIILFVGLMLGIGWPFLFNRLLQNEFSLKPNSTVLTMWKETPIPMYMSFYLFNWTNPATSIRGPEKPKFVEMGPYVFYEHHSKTNITWNSNNTVTHMNKKTWKFIPEMSNGSLTDVVTNLNVVAMTVGEKCRNLNEVYKRLANIAIKVEEYSMVTSNTVGDLLFDGCYDRFLKIADVLKKVIKTPLLPYDKFGWFYQRNGSITSDGVFNMQTGTDDINNVGQLTSWNYKNITGSYSGECAKVQGTVGELFFPESASYSDLKIFANDLCSVLTLKSEKSIVVGNLTGNLFRSMNMFDNKTSCYCPQSGCPARGVRDVSSCKGAPAFISMPHFYDADPSYREAVDGMNPDVEKHSFYMVLEQVSSTPLDVRGRLQINILMDSIPGMSFFSNLKKTYVPMIWFEQSATITNAMEAQLLPLANLSYYAPFVMFGFASFGAVLLTLGLFVRSRSCCLDEEDRLL